MKKIKSIKYRVELSYKNAFIFDEIGEADAFISRAVRHAEDPEGVERFFELYPIVEYEEEVEPIYCDTDQITEVDRMKFKQMLNENYGVASADKEVIENNEDVHQD